MLQAVRVHKYVEGMKTGMAPESCGAAEREREEGGYYIHSGFFLLFVVVVLSVFASHVRSLQGRMCGSDTR